MRAPPKSVDMSENYLLRQSITQEKLGHLGIDDVGSVELSVAFVKTIGENPLGAITAPPTRARGAAGPF